MNKEKIDNIINKLRVGPYFAPSVTYGVLSILFVLIVLMAVSGCRDGNAQTVLPLDQTPKSDTLSSDVRTRYIEYVKENRDSASCISIAEFSRIYEQIRRRAAIDSVIFQYVRTDDSIRRIREYVTPWPGANRQLRDTGR